jgi:type II secretory pathway pseudopilin PulG
MIGVIAIIGILMAIVGPNLIRKVIETTSTREGRNLQVLADTLDNYIRKNQSIPGGATWVNALSSFAKLSPTEVRYADPANPVTSGRVFMIHPGFTPSTGTDPVYALGSAGTVAPTNARILIISSTKRGLALPVTSGKAANTAANRTRFDNIWNWSLNPFTKAPPTGWPAAWNGGGEHLHVQRIDLSSLFHHVTVSNPNFPTNIPFAKFNQLSTYAFDVTNAVDAYYPEGTVIRFYRHDEPYVGPPANPDELSLTHVVQSDANFLYDGAPARWKVE